MLHCNKMAAVALPNMWSSRTSPWPGLSLKMTLSTCCETCTDLTKPQNSTHIYLVKILVRSQKSFQKTFFPWSILLINCGMQWWIRVDQVGGSRGS